MKIGKMITSAVACASLVGLAPAYAADNTAAISRLSIAKIGGANGMPSRAGTKLKKSNSIHGSTAIVAILALAAVVGGSFAIISKNSQPTSP